MIKKEKGAVVVAQKGDLVGEFSQMSWDIGHPEKRGWQKVGVKSDAVMVEVEKIPIVESVIEDDEEVVVEAVEENTEEVVEEVVVESTQEEIDDDLYPTDQEMKKYLKGKKVKFHPNIGTKKLRAKYDENKK